MNTSPLLTPSLHRWTRRLLGFAALPVVLSATAAQAAVTTPGASASQYANSATLAGVTVPAGTNRLLVVTASDAGSPTPPSAVTFNGTAMQLVTTVSDGSAASDSIWVLPLGTSGSPTTANVVITASGTVEKFIAASVFEGVHQSSPAVAGPTFGNASGTNLGSSIVVTSAVGNAVYDVFDTFRNTGGPAASTVGPLQTGIHSQSGAVTAGVSSAGFAHYTTSTEPGAASVTMSWTSTADAVLHATIEIKAAPPTAPAPSVTGTVTILNTQSTSGLVITPNSGSVTHYKITSITNGTLFKNDGSTQITNNSFITLAEGAAGLKFTPTPGFTGAANFAVAGAFDGSGTGLGPTVTANILVGSAVAAGDLVIREFRLRGPASPSDEYVVIHNRTSAAIVVGATDGSAGFAVASSDGNAVFTIPNGTTIKARGHFLAVNTSAFSLGVAPDATWTTNIADGLGLALFTTANPASFAAATPLDAVGVVGGSAPYIEGAGLPSLASVGGEYAWVRKAVTDTVQDTNANASDFVLVATDGALYNGVQAVLGSPAPTRMAFADVYSGLTVALIEPNLGINAPPNRARVLAGGDRLEFRRRITNNTASTITSLRLHFTELTTYQSPGYSPGTSQADLRPNTGPTAAIAPTTSTGVTSVSGLTLLPPPTQAIGGGLNSILLIPGSLAPGASLDINIALYITRVGSYRFFATVEGQ
ncbi:MAG: hypothetical protein K1Y01_08655 [Vicinamibacteria bacterium]|nr:hypothetical protein [Vicinamibacteria bacterium]